MVYGKLLMEMKRKPQMKRKEKRKMALKIIKNAIPDK
jgi:hypothetical protein